MKVTLKISLCVIALSGAYFMTSAQAADAVYQRANQAGVIELSNIDEANADQVPVSVDLAPKAATSTTSSAQMAPVPTSTRSSATRTTKQTRADGEVDETCLERDVADRAQCELDAKTGERSASTGSATTEPRSTSIPSGSGWNVGTSIGNLTYGTGANETATGGTSNPTNSAGGSTANNPPGASGGTTAGAGTSDTSGGAGGTGAVAGTVVAGGSGSSTGITPVVPKTPVTPVTPGATVDSGLASVLQQYRQLMVQEAATSITNGNPATSRRYLMMDRNTYMNGTGVGP
jgi:hypothetical protein